MRRVALCVAASLLVGCAPHQARRTRRAAEVGIGVSLLGVIAGSLAIAALPKEKPILIPITVGFGGLAVASTIVFGIAHANVPPPLPPAPPPPAPDNREEAWTLTKQAQSAARAGDCGTVATLASHVRTLDQDFYTSVFARDAAIVRCIHGRTPLSPP